MRHRQLGMRQQQLVERPAAAATRSGTSSSASTEAERGSPSRAASSPTWAPGLDHGVGDLAAGGGIIDDPHPAGDQEQHVAIVGLAAEHDLAGPEAAPGAAGGQRRAMCRAQRCQQANAFEVARCTTAPLQPPRARSRPCVQANARRPGPWAPPQRHAIGELGQEQQTRWRMQFADRSRRGPAACRAAWPSSIWPSPSSWRCHGVACPWALEVARRLAAPLDLVLVRKIGAPGHEELAAGRGGRRRAAGAGAERRRRAQLRHRPGLARPAAGAAAGRDRAASRRSTSAAGPRRRSRGGPRSWSTTASPPAPPSGPPCTRLRRPGPGSWCWRCRWPRPRCWRDLRRRPTASSACTRPGT